MSDDTPTPAQLWKQLSPERRLQAAEAFWRDENSATPDVETYNAVEPGMATMAGAMIVGISSP